MNGTIHALIPVYDAEPGDAPQNVCVVKLITTTWADKRGLHIKKSLTFLRRKCAGFNVLEGEVDAIGAKDAARIIINLDECADGIYEVAVCNETHDWESGYVDGYDLKLLPFAASKAMQRIDAALAAKEET